MRRKNFAGGGVKNAFMWECVHQNNVAAGVDGPSKDKKKKKKKKKTFEKNEAEEGNAVTATTRATSLIRAGSQGKRWGGKKGKNPHIRTKIKSWGKTDPMNPHNITMPDHNEPKNKKGVKYNNERGGAL